MAVSYANREILFSGSWRLLYVEITLDSSYATSGESIAAADLGFKVIRAIFPAEGGGYVVEPVRTDDDSWLLKVYGYSSSTNTATEMVSGKDLSSVQIPCLVVGR